MRTHQLLVTTASCQIDQRMLCAYRVCVCLYTLTLTHTSHECNSNRVYSLFFLNLTANLKRSIHTSYTPARVARRMPVVYACACLWYTPAHTGICETPSAKSPPLLSFSLLLLCPRQTPCAQQPSICIGGTGLIPLSFVTLHYSIV
jgi:hypothetical protein